MLRPRVKGTKASWIQMQSFCRDNILVQAGVAFKGTGFWEMSGEPEQAVSCLSRIYPGVYPEELALGETSY